MTILEDYAAQCPYCGEVFTTVIDLSSLDIDPVEQDYIEDCQVCCRPIRFIISRDVYSEQPIITLRREDD